MNPYLQKIYREIPETQCPDNCHGCCGVVAWSDVENDNIRAWLKERGKPMLKTTVVDPNGFTCPYWMDSDGCTIYPVRPLVCRLYGITDERDEKRGLDMMCSKCKSKERVKALSKSYARGLMFQLQLLDAFKYLNYDFFGWYGETKDSNQVTENK